MMRLTLLLTILLAGLSLAPASADTLTYNPWAGYSCTGYDCSYTYTNIPEFDPLQGTLYEIDWTLSENGDVDIDPDLCGEPWDPITPTPYSYTSTLSDSFLNGAGSITTSKSGINYGGCAGSDNIGYLAWLTFGNSITDPGDLSAFIGTGDASASTDPSVSASEYYPYFRNWDYELTITYDYTPAGFTSEAPEPRWTVIALISLLLVVAYRRRVRSN
jgi:hypothetical protein